MNGGSSILKPLDRAAERAYANIDRTFRFESDPALRLYQQLKPEDFNAITQAYGPDAVVSYIQAMESRNMKGG